MNNGSVELDYPLRTERLTLRPLNSEDLASHHRLFSDPQVVRYLYDAPMGLGEAQAQLERRMHANLPVEGEWLNLAVEADGVFVGEVGVSLVSRVHGHCEIGYVFDPRYQGRGYATEAASRMIDVAFEQLGAHRVTAQLDARNERSARVLERLGLRREALLRENEFVKGEWTDEIMYAVLADEWARRERTTTGVEPG
jgi:RimJ/RimL family protein N-acetyltransferase